MDCSPSRFLGLWNLPGKNTGVSSHSFSRGSSWPRNPTWVSYTGRQILSHWTTRRPTQDILALECNVIRATSDEPNLIWPASSDSGICTVTDRTNLWLLWAKSGCCPRQRGMSHLNQYPDFSLFLFKSLLRLLLQYCFCFMFWVFGHEACGILASGDQTHTPCIGRQS